MRLRGIRNLIFLGLGVSLFSFHEKSEQPKIEFEKKEVKMEEKPAYLYKVLSMEDWGKSKAAVHLSDMDRQFIHLSTENQLDKIIEKYWSDASERWT